MTSPEEARKIAGVAVASYWLNEFPVISANKVLCLEIEQQLVSRMDPDESRFDAGHIRRALAKHVNSEPYVNSFRLGATRFDLNGQPVGIVS